MRSRLPVVACAVFGWLILGLVEAGRGQGSAADYERAAGLRERYRGKVFRDRVEPQVFDGGKKFWYRNDLPDGAREFVLVDAEAGTRAPAFDADRLARALGERRGEPIDPARPPFDRIALSDDLRTLRFDAFGRGWTCDRETYELSESDPHNLPAPRRSREGGEPGPRRGQRPSLRSPDGRFRVSIKDHNLFVRDALDDSEFALTSDGKPGDAYGPQVYWSPDSSRLLAMRTRAGGDRKVYLIESSPRSQFQPKLHSYEYLKPGDPIPTRRPHLFDVPGRREIPLSDELFSVPWSIERVRWEPDGSRVRFLYNERGHQVLRLIAVDASDGTAEAIVEETSPTFVDYAHKLFLHELDATSELIWMSERDGWNHLYRIDASTGAARNAITSGEWVVRGVDRVDEQRGEIWFRAGGIHPGQDPYHIHYARVNLDGSGLTLLTHGDGTHRLEFLEGGRYYIDTYSRVDLAPVTELRRADDGSLVLTLERADVSALAAAGWRPPERFVAKGRDGVTDIYGVIYRPSNFDPMRKYPVLERVYAGPQGAFVPKAFRPLHGPEELAELGFVVVQADGMGTSYRSKAFHDVCWKNLADAGFPDRIAWIRAAAQAYPQLDLSRVGIYGGSAGGQSALRALIAHNDFYRAAVADCGCHDNRMDKIWWNELWMGWPVGPHYEEQSNVTQAHRLKGDLLLIVGELDRNVDPSSTLQVVNALIRADKDFEFLLIPGAGHGAAETPYGRRRLRDFFVRRLLGVEPRHESGG